MDIKICFLIIGSFFFLIVQPFSSIAGIGNAVRVTEGLLSGIPGSDPDIIIYKGIPYASPPVGDLRWRPPQPPNPWEVIRKADKFAPGCIQTLAKSRLPWTEEFMHQGDISEDCLYLNIWTPSKASHNKYPVMVYFHGGGFGEGSGSVAVYDGEELARKGVVAVTINYRLGVLGFLAHPELTKESDHGSSGNYGLLDQVEALKWIQKNIAAFGGDPDNVTIFGQSAGAMSAYILTASPLAKGLFHRAIIQSGPGALAAFGLTSASDMARNIKSAEEDGLRFAEKVGANSLKELRKLPADKLIHPVEESRTLRFGPVIDGYLLPDNVDAIYGLGKNNDIPFIMGMNADEMSAFPGYGKIKAKDFIKQVQAQYGDESDTFFKLYPATTDEDAGMSQKISAREIGLVAMSLLAAERAKSSKTDLYLYYFNKAIPWPEHPEFGAFHTGEVPYVFNNLKMMRRPWQDADWKVADAVSSYWINFAYSGNPNGKGLPVWPAYYESNVRLIKLGDPVKTTPLPEQTKIDFFKAYLKGCKLKKWTILELLSFNENGYNIMPRSGSF